MSAQTRSSGSLTPVGDLINSEAVTVLKTTTLDGVAHVMGDLGIGMVIVMDDETVAGVVSERDLVWAIARDAVLDEVWAADIMTTDVVAVEPSMSAGECAALMSSTNARHILVLSGDTPGVVSIRDLIEYLID